jgi:hypothetical protein
MSVFMRRRDGTTGLFEHVFVELLKDILTAESSLADTLILIRPVAIGKDFTFFLD